MERHEPEKKEAELLYSHGPVRAQDEYAAGDFRYHMHNEFEIFFFVQGDVSYIVEQQVYTLLPGDILLFNNTEFHYPTFRSNAEFERIVLHFDPTVAQQFSTPRTPLLHRFLSRPQGEQNLVRLAPCERERFRALALSIEQESQSGRTGDDVLAAAHLSELLVLLARAPQAQPQAGRLSRMSARRCLISMRRCRSLFSGGSRRALSVDRFYLEKTFKRKPAPRYTITCCSNA